MICAGISAAGASKWKERSSDNDESWTRWRVEETFGLTAVLTITVILGTGEGIG
jgi:hypothetical protein